MTEFLLMLGNGRAGQTRCGQNKSHNFKPARQSPKVAPMARFRQRKVTLPDGQEVTAWIPRDGRRHPMHMDRGIYGFNDPVEKSYFTAREYCQHPQAGGYINTFFACQTKQCAGCNNHTLSFEALEDSKTRAKALSLWEKEAAAIEAEAALIDSTEQKEIEEITGPESREMRWLKEEIDKLQKKLIEKTATYASMTAERAARPQEEIDEKVNKVKEKNTRCREKVKQRRFWKDLSVAVIKKIASECKNVE